MGTKWKLGTALLAATIALSACQSDDTASKDKDKADQPKAEETAYGNFASFGYDLGLTRHVPYDEITKENVGELGLVWSKSFKELNADIPNGNQSFPIVIDGVAYVTTSGNYVYAFDAVTGEVKWTWEPPAEVKETTDRNGMINSNRGVAVGDGKVFIITADVGLASIDQETGETIDFIHLKDFFSSITPENGYYETTAPTYYDGKVFVGSSGGDNGIRGFEMAFNGEDLTPAWDEPFWTVPPKGEDWLAEGLFGGGGAVWMPPSVDEKTNTLFFSAGNPAPDFYGERRPGENPHTNSLLAVDPDTGKLKWEHQQVSHDLWDYDTADSPSVYDATIDGEKRHVVAVGTKGGEWFVYDAESGDPIYENVPFTRIQHDTPTPEGVTVYPGVLGGQNYAPNTYDPELNLDLIPGVEQGAVIKSAANEEEALANDGGGKGGAQAFGTSIAMSVEGEKPYGSITAFDLNTGEQAWQIKTDDPQRSGLTSTKTGLTFYGELDGSVNALDTATGEVVWEFQTTGSTISAAPSIFTVDGKEYLMITSAGSEPQVFVFALGGDKTQAEAGKAEEFNAHETTDESAAVEETGNVVDVTINATNFEFDPGEIHAKLGDTVRLTLHNEDGMHGVALDEYDVALQDGDTVEFVADKTGEFQFYCNIMCGQGHDNMNGKLIVEE